MTYFRHFLCFACATVTISLAIACNRQPEGTSDTFDQSKATTTSSIQSEGTTGATDYNNDSVMQGTDGGISPDTLTGGNPGKGSSGSSHNR